MGAKTIDSFKQLLNEISHELTEENLRSLIHISGVPGGSLRTIKDGLTLFRYLIDVDFISKKNIGNLRNLLRKMRPRRRDLVAMVDEYIKKENNTDNVSEVLGELSQSWQQVHSIRFTPGDDTHAKSQPLFNIDCSYMNCVCHRFPSCYLTLLVLLGLALIVTCIFWYAHVPRVTRSINANEDLKEAGVYIIIAELLFIVVLACRYGWKHCRYRGYVNFTNITVQGESTARPNGSISRSKSTDAAGKAKLISAPRAYKYSTSTDYGSPESAVFSDQSGFGSVSTVDVMEPQDV